MCTIVEQKPCTLTGFNNLKKALSFSFYDFVIVPTEKERLSYISYINENYSAEKISKLLQSIVDAIGAKTLHSSLQNYEPYGASTLMLLSDIKSDEPPKEQSVSMHLNKSHITAHTYPDFDNENGIFSFRVDIELSTCGEIIPLTSLDKIFNFFDTDIVTIDYVVRGFTRNDDKKHIFIDHEVSTIRDYISDDILKDYATKDLILQNEYIWQLKLLRKEMNTDEYFSPETKITNEKKEELISNLQTEMRSVFNSHCYS
jgi:S-adenosylmethionine decarboxylase